MVCYEQGVVWRGAARVVVWCDKHDMLCYDAMWYGMIRTYGILSHNI